MDNKKDDRYYIEKVIENINAIIQYNMNLSYDDFISDIKGIDATMFRLIQMAENISHISKEYKESHSNIKWGKLLALEME